MNKDFVLKVESPVEGTWQFIAGPRCPTSMGRLWDKTIRVCFDYAERGRYTLAFYPENGVCSPQIIEIDTNDYIDEEEAP